MRYCFLMPTAALLLVLLTLGCYGTRYQLIEASNATVDHALCGDWAIENADDPNDLKTLHVRNIDEHQYVLSWNDEVNGKADLYIGWVGQVKRLPFMHARQMPVNGNINAEHLIIRFELKDDKLTFRHLNKAFMEAHNVDSDEALRRVIADNLESADLYDADTVKAHRLAEQ